MVIDLALSTGLRVSETAASKIKDLELKRGAISVVRLKRKKKKKETMTISKEVVQHLKQFIEWKKSLGQSTKPTSMLFVGGRGKLLPRDCRGYGKRQLRKQDCQRNCRSIVPGIL